MVAQKAPEKVKRGDGPMAVTFGDSAGKKDYKRVPANVDNVVVLSRKTNTTKEYSISALPEAVRNQMVAYALAARAKQAVNNHADDDTDVLSLVDGIYNELAEGKMYAKAAEGKGPGKKFDASLIVEAFSKAIEFKIKKGLKRKDGSALSPLSEKQREDLKVKLESMPGTDRKEYIKELHKSEYFKKAYAELKARKIKVGSEDSLEDFI